MKNNGRDIGCFIRIENNMSYFSQSELKVAQFVLSHPKKVVLASGEEIAQATNTSISSITRFCKRIGFSGFQEFKITLSQNIAEPLSTIHEDIKLGDNIETIKNKITQSNIHALESTMHVLDTNELKKAIECLVTAETIAFFGMGGSGSIALDAQHKFLRTGKKCIASVDKHIQLIYASMFKKKDVMVGITHSGYNKDMLDIFKLGQKNAMTIAITHNAKSPILKLANIKLYTSSKETAFRPESLSSRIAVLTIIDMLYVGMGLRIHERILNNLKKIRNAILFTRANEGKNLADR
jgi:DNA-binding MurR/RpiR family transcriptional regulator